MFRDRERERGRAIEADVHLHAADPVQPLQWLGQIYTSVSAGMKR